MKILFRSFFAAIACFLLMFAARFTYEMRLPEEQRYNYTSSSQWSDFQYSKKNYASEKSIYETRPSAPKANGLVGSEKYEKIANISQTTTSFEAENKALQTQITLNDGVVQYEAASGLKGNRRIDLGIGIPPEKFDGFLESAQKIGTLTHLSVLKNDKTSEYQKLRAKRATLEQARTAVAEMRNLNASVDERLRLEARYNEIESQIQDLSVSLGDFDTQNEFYTVKLSMREVGVKQGVSLERQLWRSFKWTLEYYFYLTFGLFFLTSSIAIGVLLFKGIISLIKLGAKRIEG